MGGITGLASMILWFGIWFLCAECRLFGDNVIGASLKMRSTQHLKSLSYSLAYDLIGLGFGVLPLLFPLLILLFPYVLIVFPIQFLCNFLLLGAHFVHLVEVFVF